MADNNTKYVKVKKRYNKVIAYFLSLFSSCIIDGIAMIALVFMPEMQDMEERNLAIGGSVALLLGGILGIFLITLYINSRTPKGERLQTWFRAFVLGWKMVFKVALAISIVFIPFAIKLGVGYYDYDYTATIGGSKTRLKKIGPHLYEDMNGNKWTDKDQPDNFKYVS